MAQIFVLGNVTEKLNLKESQNKIPYICFDFAEHIGYGGNQRTLFYQVWAWGDNALRLIRIGVKQGSQLWLTGSQELVDCTINSGKVKTKRLKVIMDNCGYLPGWKPKQNGGDLPNQSAVSPDMAAVLPMEVLDGEREALPE